MGMICENCYYYVVLNPHHIINGKPVKHCSNGLKPEREDFCFEMVVKVVELEGV